MLTTYKLRLNARWHDGAPVTAGDYVLGYRVYVDPEMPIRDRVPETLMTSVGAIDEYTLAIAWAQPYVGANLLTFQQLSPLPRHLVEETYRTNKTSLVYGEDWTSGYVGTGPFRVASWNPGSSLIARANTDWFLGPPRVEAIDIRFISDSTTMLANLLAGDVDLINSPGIRMTEAAVARDQWVARGEGYLKSWQRQLRFHSFQFREVPKWQRAIADVRVRRALMHATDRVVLAETLTYGLGFEANGFINPADPLFPDVDRGVRKYPYDPRAALSLLAETGWTAAQPGSQLTGAGGQPLDVELWITAEGGGQQEALIVEDNWKRIGINASLFLIPAARQRDNELRASFPAVSPTARSVTLDNFVFVSTHLPTLETRWQGANRGSFHDGEIDRLHNLGLTSLDVNERRGATIALHSRMAEILGIGPLYYNVEVLLARRTLLGPIGEVAEKSGMSWNCWEWELTS